MLQAIKIGLVLFLGLVALAVLGFNSFLVEPCLRFALGRVEARTGTAIGFEKATGNLVTGELAVTGVRLERKAEGRNQFELKVGNLSADVAMLRFFDPEWCFDSVHLTGLKGRFTVVARDKAATPLPEGRKVFNAERITVASAEIEHVNLRDGGEPITVVLDSGRVDGYRSDWSLYDLLFRSTLEGKIDGQPFRIEGTDEGGKRKTLWDLRGLPVGKWKGAVSGPLGALRSGRIDCQVVSRWPLGDPRTIDQEWRLVVQDGTADPAAGGGGLSAVATRAAVGWLLSKSRNVPLEFPVQLTRDRFDGAESLADAGLLDAVSKAAGQKLVELSAGAGGSLLERARSRLGLGPN